MRKPISEHKTTIKAGKGKGESLLEPVSGGRVRRVEFRDEVEPAFREEPERVYRPHDDTSIDQIHFEVDNLDRLRRGSTPRARRRQDTSSKRVFDTSRGGVNASRMETTSGERRVLYTARRRGSREEEQRFHSGLVDRIISEKYNAGPTFETVDEPKRKILKPKKAKKAKASKADQAEEAVFQPQCEAVTRDGVQCRNSAKGGSEFCGSHQTYAPRGLEEVLDTKPSKGTDTLPGTGDKAGTGQCSAYTKEGMQCKRSSRKNSKYCSTHKGYRAPSKGSLEDRLDTKPRHKGAKDTKPRLK